MKFQRGHFTMIIRFVKMEAFSRSLFKWNHIFLHHFLHEKVLTYICEKDYVY